MHNLVDASTPQAHPAPPLDRWWTGFIVEAPRLAVGKSAAPDPAAAACAWRSRTQRAYGAKTRRAHTGTESSHDSPREGNGFELSVPRQKDNVFEAPQADSAIPGEAIAHQMATA